MQWHLLPKNQTTLPTRCPRVHTHTHAAHTWSAVCNCRRHLADWSVADLVLSCCRAYNACDFGSERLATFGGEGTGVEC